MRRHGEAERAHRRALELNPNFALAYCLLGCALALQGWHEEAIKSAEYALRLSPSDPLIGRYSAFAVMYGHFAAGRYADSMTWARVLNREMPRTPLGLRPARRSSDDLEGGGRNSRRAHHAASSATGFLVGLAERECAIRR